MDRINAKRMFGQYCAHALVRHVRWDLLVDEIEAEAAQRGLPLTVATLDLIWTHFKKERRAAALRRAKRATVKLNRRIGRRP